MRTSSQFLNNNRSGHKYGLVYAGVGWILWRNEDELPEHLKFELHYLGGASYINCF
jgi:glutamate/tyrosine decarboxylase-like PLP-dependent enzyme